MARPKKDPTEKKTLRHPVAMTVAQKTLLDKKAQLAGMDLSPYLLACGLNRKINPPIQHFDRLSLAQLAGIGNNLNQLAKHANSAGITDSALQEVLTEVRKLKDILIKTGRE